MSYITEAPGQIEALGYVIGDDLLPIHNLNTALWNTFQSDKPPSFSPWNALARSYPRVYNASPSDGLLLWHSGASSAQHAGRRAAEAVLAEHHSRLRLCGAIACAVLYRRDPCIRVRQHGCQCALLQQLSVNKGNLFFLALDPANYPQITTTHVGILRGTPKTLNDRHRHVLAGCINILSRCVRTAN